MKIAGLPEGVELVRFGIATADEFEVLNDTTTTDAPLLSRGPRAGSSAQVIVRPSEGWEFRRKRAYDIKILESLETPFFGPVKILAAPLEITATVTFRVESDQDHDGINLALAALKRLPGFVSIT